MSDLLSRGLRNGAAAGIVLIVACASPARAQPAVAGYVKSVSGAGSTRLTSGAIPDFQPVFSPDGTRLAFLRRSEGRLQVME